MWRRNFSVSAAILFLIFVSGTAPEKHLKLPSYIKPCSKSASDFEECCQNSANDAIAGILNGDKEYNIPPLNPLVIPKVELVASGFRLLIKDLHLFGFDTTTIKKAKFDLTKNVLSVNTYHKYISLVGQYECDGKILILPIEGNGNINLTFSDLEIRYSVNYKLENIGGDDFIVIPDDSSIDYTLSRAYFDFENLFGGNNELATTTLRALNDGWEQFVEALKPVISETILKIVQSIAGAVTSNVPIKYIFLD